jgi:methylenetetrahydrofolate dehydrogenase (NADP+)/methenyltetrahydrofolate cyclohydrolase
VFTHSGLRETSITRADALQQSEIVITGVPRRDFKLIEPDEIRSGAICINFSTLKNFQDDIQNRASVFIPSVGSMTITMALRNTVRLYQNGLRRDLKTSTTNGSTLAKDC